MNVPRYLLVFLLGVFAGGIGNRWFGKPRHPHAPSVDFLVGRLTRRLSLDETQQAAARAILVEDQGKLMELHRRTREQLEEQRRATHERLAALLKPEQKERFQKLTARWDASHVRNWGAPPPK